MQTFLPLPDFAISAAHLDDKRLGKQRVEAFQVLNVLFHEETGEWLKVPEKVKLNPMLDYRYGWTNHPVTKMWRGHAGSLAIYMNEMMHEWIRRGFRNNMLFIELGWQEELPTWIGDDGFHASHRSNLIRKDPKFYGLYGWEEGPDLPYVWPVP